MGRYSKELVQELYASYVSTQVYISLPAIHRYLYSVADDAHRTPHTIEFDYRWQIVKDGQFLREPSLRETTKRWMALHLSIDGEGADWVTKPKGAIKKANITFTTKFLCLIVRHYLSPTAADSSHMGSSTIDGPGLR